MRGQLGISDHAVVVTFIGRLTRDKGVSELVDAFAKLPVRQHPCVLLLVGPQEPDRDPLPVNTLEKIRADHRIIEVGYSPEPEKYLALTDIFCLPSYREGFGNVVVEAAAMGIPTVGTDIVGLRDAVVNNVTGLLVPPKNVDGLAAGLEKLLLDAQLRHEMGDQAKLRARREFDSSIVNAAVLNEYDRLALQFLGQRSV